MNGRPLSMRKKVEVMVALTLLAWATQTLFQQWGFGNELASQQRRAEQPTQGDSERFIPGTARFAAGATLEMRTEATILGADVKLKQVCRWSGADDAVFAPLADLILVRFGEGKPFKPVTIEQVRSILHDAGVNLGAVRFSGPTSCVVARSDAEYDEGNALLEWANARQGAESSEGPATTASDRLPHSVGATRPVLDETVVATAEDVNDHTLRSLLVRDLAERFNLSAEDLLVTFTPKDDAALRLAEPQFRFDIQPRRLRNLGAVSWDVQVLTGGGEATRKSQRITISATARAWQQQVVLTRPLSFKQTIRHTDVAERRILVDTLDDEPLLNIKQVVSQQAARELKPGTVMTAKTVQAVPLARSGQFVTVLLGRGGVSIKTVARAMEEGSYGQTIKVKNEATKDVFEVVLTGPQEATLGPMEALEVSARTE